MKFKKLFAYMMLWIWLSFHHSSLRLLSLTCHLDYYSTLLKHLSTVDLFPPKKLTHDHNTSQKSLLHLVVYIQKYLSFFLEQLIIICNMSSFCTYIFTQHYTSGISFIPDSMLWPENALTWWTFTYIIFHMRNGLIIA